MYLILEDGDALYAGRLLALIRTDGETSILTLGGEAKSSFYTPAAIDRRSRIFWKRAGSAWKEQQK